MRLTSYLALILLAGAGNLANAAPAEFEIVIKNHQFTPSIVTVPAGVKVKLKVTNNDATPEEFESYKLNREKIIPGNSSAHVFIGPLEAGEYEFFGEFNQATAQGRIVVQ